jgi:hypothetical protein
MGLHVKYSLFLSDFNERWISSTDFRKIFKFHENPSSGRRVFPCGQTDVQTDVTNLVVAFRNFVNAPKREHNWNITEISRNFLTYNAATSFRWHHLVFKYRIVNIGLFFQTMVVTPSTFSRGDTFLKAVLHAGSSRLRISRIEVLPKRRRPPTRPHGVIIRIFYFKARVNKDTWHIITPSPETNKLFCTVLIY